MLRIRNAARLALTILSLLAAIAAPALLQGYSALRRGEADMVRRQYALAGSELETAARLLIWRPQLWEKAGMGYASAGDWAHAMALFQQAEGRGALSADGWDVFGTGYWLQSENAEALDAWTSGLRAYPSHVKFHSRLALAYRGLGEYQAERQALEVWLAAGNGTAGEHYRLGQLLMIDDLARARTELAQASAMDETFEPAARTLQTAADLASDAAKPPQRMISVGRGLGLVDEWLLAGQAFEGAVQADPRNAQAWAWLGEARQHVGLDGSTELDRASKLDPNDPVILGLNALYYRRRGDYVKELGWYSLAARLEPQNPEWQAGMAEARALGGDLIAALEYYQKAVRLAPDDAAYWRLLAIFCADNAIQVQDIGLPAAKKAASLAPNDPIVLDTLGWSYTQAGLLFNAEQNLLKAVKLNPGLALAHLHLGEMYLRKGDPASARAELRKASELDADGPVGAMAGKLLQQYFP